MPGFKYIMYRSCHVFIAVFDCLFMLLCSLYSKVQILCFTLSAFYLEGHCTQGSCHLHKWYQCLLQERAEFLKWPVSTTGFPQPNSPFLCVLLEVFKLFFSFKNILQHITNHKVLSDYSLFMPDIKEIETKPVVKKGRLEIEAKVTGI